MVPFADDFVRRRIDQNAPDDWVWVRVFFVRHRVCKFYRAEHVSFVFARVVFISRKRKRERLGKEKERERERETQRKKKAPVARWIGNLLWNSRSEHRTNTLDFLQNVVFVTSKCSHKTKRARARPRARHKSRFFRGNPPFPGEKEREGEKESFNARARAIINIP
jgi:hypothetical protein